MSKTGSPHWLATPAVARRIGVSLPTVRSWIESGQLRAIDASTGRKQPRFRVHIDDLAAFEAGRTVRPRIGGLRGVLNYLLDRCERIGDSYDADVFPLVPSRDDVELAYAGLNVKGKSDEAKQVWRRFELLRQEAEQAQHGDQFKARALKRAKDNAAYVRQVIQTLG